MVVVTRKVRFSAAHFFWLPELSEAENRERFGRVGNRHGHGHNYELEVAVAGDIDADTGMVVNLKDLKRILREEVVEPLDFNSLNHDVPFFRDRLPTLENLVIYLWERIAPRMAPLPLRLAWLKLSEADDMFVEYAGGAPLS